MLIPRHLCRFILLHIILFSLLLFAPGSPGANAADTIDKGGNITDGNTLVSAGRSFTLGFFSPAGVPTKRYLGIWFSVSADTVYWVANRDHPLNDTSGVLVMSDSGSLLLLDGAGNTVWSSGSTNSPSAGAARLLESGNFVVVQGQNSGGAALWQAFDHPCDSMLPGMKIGKNRWTGGTEWSLTSWRSASDPAPGNFRYITSAVGIPENVLLDLGRNSSKVYRTGPWNGKRFNGVPEMSQFADNFTFQLTDSPSEVTYGYVAKAGAAYSRVTVTEAGHVQRLVWDDAGRAWKSFSDAPRDPCDNYAKCGPFGLCDSDAMATSLCGCVQGFSPMSRSEWSIREYSHGCLRNVALDCGSNSNQSRATSTDGFAVLTGVKLPDTDGASVDKGISLDECRARCLANCSCVAYAAADLTQGGEGAGCVMWTNSFVDVRLIDQGQDFYLRLAKSEIRQQAAGGKKTKKLSRPAIAAIVSGLVFLLVVAVTLLLRRLTRRSFIPIDVAAGHTSTPTRHPELAIPSIDFRIIEEVTENFSTSRQIGEGNFGRVYEAVLPENESTMLGIPIQEKVAVKKLKKSDMNTYKRELDLMSKLSHVNLLRLLASSHEIDDDNNEGGDAALVLIYEYMNKGSLDNYIFGDKRADLSWTQRLQIISSIAQGILYLHETCGKLIIHRDLKPDNILLADDWTPKIADFGLAKHVTDADHTPMGPLGYSAPECWGGKPSDKSDVYSFGVMLLEIISGRRNGVMQSLLPHAWNYWNNEGRTLEELLDRQVPLSQDELADHEKLGRCIQIGLLCVQVSPHKRPKISQVVEMLRSERSLPTPKVPTLREDQGET